MIKNFFRKWLAFSILLALFVFGNRLAYAADGPGSISFFKRTGSVVSLVKNTYQLGDATHRVAAIYGTNADFTNLVVGGIVTGNLDVDGYNIILDQDGNTAIIGSRDGTIGNDAIGITIGGTARFKFATTTFEALTGSQFKTDTIVEETGGNGVVVGGITLKNGASLVIQGGANTFSLTNGTASITAAAASALALNANLTVSGVSLINQDLRTTASTVAFAGLASSGTINFSGLTASRLVATDGSKNLVNTITSANLASTVSDETGSGLAVFATSPTLTTPAITGGTLDNSVIGGVTPAAATFTTIASSGLHTWSAGSALTAASYQIGRDNGGTNQMAFNVPTGAGFAFSQNGTQYLTSSAVSGDYGLKWTSQTGAVVSYYNTAAGNGPNTAQVYIQSSTATSTRQGFIYMNGTDYGLGSYSSGTNTLIYSSNTARMSFGTGGNTTTAYRFELGQGASVAAANDLTLGVDGNVFNITGNTTINAITTNLWQAGSKITLIFSGTPTVKHNTAGGAGTAKIFLSGAVDFVAEANATLDLVYDGTQWQETGRKVPSAASTISAGVYTPTFTNVANLDGSTASECQYSRVGATVTVGCKVTIDPTLTATSTQLGISLPVASNIGATEDVAGSCFASGIVAQGASILGDAANDRAQLQYISADTTNQPMYCTFVYQVI